MADEPGPSSGGKVDDWLAWIRMAEELVREWERERGSMLPTHDATRLVEKVARALHQASQHPRRRRWA